MLTPENEIRQVGDLMLADVPKECVSALICGPRASSETRDALQAKAIQLECKYYELKIGRSSCLPFLVDLTGTVFVFNDKAIENCSSYCSKCREPLSKQSKLCSWCQIEDSHKLDAAQRNTYRVLAHAGLLDDYIAEMRRITRGG